jgi:transcriptional regulator with XRE-family HTH domain
MGDNMLSESNSKSSAAACRGRRNLMPRYLRAEDVLAEELRDPAFRAEWERTALARAVALRVLGYRVEHGLSQTALAQRLGLPQSAITRLELGEHTPSIETLRRLSDGLGMEFLLHVAPTTRPPHWHLPPSPAGSVVERAQSEQSSVLAAAS